VFLGWGKRRRETLLGLYLDEENSFSSESFLSSSRVLGFFSCFSVFCRNGPVINSVKSVLRLGRKSVVGKMEKVDLRRGERVRELWMVRLRVVTEQSEKMW